MRRKSHFAMLLLASLSFSTMASGQARNPFQPAASGSGLSKAEVQRIVAEETAKKNSAAPGAGGAPSGSPVAPGTGVIPSQPMGPGAPSGMISSEPAVAKIDTVTAFLKAGGRFVGCAGNKPVFMSSAGRFYFTMKEVRKSDVARNLVRC